MAPAGWFDAWGVWQNPRSAPAPGPAPGTTEFVTAQLNGQLLGGLVPWGVYDEEIEQRRVLLQWPDGDHGEPTLLTMRHQPWRHPQWATPHTAASDTAPTYRVGAPPLLDPFLIPAVPAPQVRSLVYVPPGRVVPNFGFTPRTCVSPARLREFLQSTDASIVAMPALAGMRLLRLYYHSAAVGWAVASNACARETPEPGGPHAPAVAQLLARARRGDLERSRAYCFAALRDPQTGRTTERTVFVGILAVHTRGHGQAWERLFLPPCAQTAAMFTEQVEPLTAEQAAALVCPNAPPIGVCGPGFRVVGRTDGVLLVNRRSGHAVRVVAPLVYVLGPALRRQPGGLAVVAAFVLTSIVCGHRLHGRSREWDAHVRFVDRVLAARAPALRAATATALLDMASSPLSPLWAVVPSFAATVAQHGPDAVLQRLSALPRVIMIVAAAALAALPPDCPERAACGALGMPVARPDLAAPPHPAAAEEG